MSFLVILVLSFRVCLNINIRIHYNTSHLYMIFLYFDISMLNFILIRFPLVKRLSLTHPSKGFRDTQYCYFRLSKPSKCINVLYNQPGNINFSNFLSISFKVGITFSFPRNINNVMNKYHCI